MCVMDVRPEDPTQSVVQATLHNLSTVQRDFEMLLPVLESRGLGEDVLDYVRDANDELAYAYASLLAAYSAVVNGNVHNHDHDDVHQHGGNSLVHAHSDGGIPHEMTVPAV